MKWKYRASYVRFQGDDRWEIQRRPAWWPFYFNRYIGYHPTVEAARKRALEDAQLSRKHDLGWMP